jgi:hypothetical protein
MNNLLCICGRLKNGSPKMSIFWTLDPVKVILYDKKEKESL